MRALFNLYRLVRNERKKRDVTCTLDSLRKRTLMSCAGSRNSSGEYLGTFGNEFVKLCNIFIIDCGSFFRAENANFFSSVHIVSVSCGSLCVISIHLKKPPL